MMQAMAREEMEFDTYGFLRVGSNDQSEDADFRCHNYSSERVSDEEFTPKWSQLFQDWDHVTKETPHKIADLMKEHVPNNLRGQLWGKLLETRNARASVKLDYAKRVRDIERLDKSRAVLQEQQDDRCRAYARDYNEKGSARGARPSELVEDGKLPSVKAVRQIRLDLDRTFYTHIMFMEKDGEGQRELFRILTVYASCNPEVGYCQGMAYIAAVLLMHMKEEDAFWALYCLMESPKHFGDFYSQSLARVQEEAAVFAGLVARRMPGLAEHMEDLCIHPLMYVTQWFMCGFTSLPLWDTVLSVWDTFMLNGVVGFHRAGLSILAVCESDLMETKNISEMLPYLHHLPPKKLGRAMVLGKYWETDEVELEAHRSAVVLAIKEGIDPADLKPAFWKAQQEADRRDRRVRLEQEQSAAIVPSTPTLFKRMIAVLATPIRTKAQASREDMLMRQGRQACTPMGTPQAPSNPHDATPTMPTPTAHTTQAQRMMKRHMLGGVGSPALRAPLPNSPMGTPTPTTPTQLLSPQAVMATQDSFSPSFARSGILSPSFRNMDSILSPGDRYEAPMLLHSPSEHSSVIDAASPASKASFAAFSTVTPLRRSQVLRKPDTASAAGTTAVELFAPSAKPTAMYKSPAPSAVMEMLDVTPARTGRKRDGTQSTQSSRPYRRAAAAERSSAVAAPATALGTMVSKDKVAAMRQQYSITPLRPMNHD